MEYRGHQVFIIHPDREFLENAVGRLRDEEYETFGFGEADPLSLDRHRESVIFLYTGSGSLQDDCSLSQSLKDDDYDVHLVALGDGNPDDCFDACISGSREDLVAGILDYLKESGARGHRQHVRFGNLVASIATFEFHDRGRRYAGVVHDISVRGMSCTYMPEPEDPGPRIVTEMHVNLPGHRCTVSGRMTGRRRIAGHIIHIFMFDSETPGDIVDDLHDFIYSSLSMKLSVH